ncbi:carbon monoxide dehydrogenase CoxC signalling protein [Bradyrhizobium oligotrophicum S58]|uniref:Carbon monoxide dehydrogenase CoxC signalling protein n=1 Tax=Bradyrhizobium oligotrophicum S58 TaxID=1245469 RepID=M4ZEL6_9BRAD|nr:MHYT domain-containing protein [Bradyrhizobium oligotrophicum]BAM92179.1 carbon monoxide dehydrogenase CoxC signalling protein [Bradyrhizobium oligotrophicum S58]
MIEGYDPYLVALSVVIASLGGYTGFSLTARIRSGPGENARVLLSGAAGILAVGIWTMHFVGMMAAPLPADAVYLVLPTIISFLICALVIGISLFFVSIGDPSPQRVIPSALLLGAGIASMHYVGMHGLSGSFGLTHDPALVALSVGIAIVAAYGGLRIFLARQDGLRLAISAVAFGIAVSGMHYTAMLGMHVVPAGEGHHHVAAGLAASPQALAIVVAVLCFVIAAGFLLSLVPDPRRQSQPLQAVAEAAPRLAPEPAATASEPVVEVAAPSRVIAAPLGGIGQPPRVTAARLPLEGANGTHFIDAGDVRSVRADAHYTRIHDGTRERMCPWSISEAEAQLDPGRFIRVHRSHIVAIEHVTFVGKEGEGAIIELDGPSKPRVPVSRAKVAEVKARLGLVRRQA